MELESRIKAIEAKLRPIAQSEKEPAFSKTRYYLSSKYGLEESEDYCYECGMEKIGWVRWQIRLFLYATYDWASQHCFELRPNVYGLSVVRRRYCRNAIVVGLKLFLYLWGKADDKDWWYEGCWGENRPSATDGESDGMNFCESCGVGLDTWLTKAGAYTELEHWLSDPFQEQPSPYEASELLLLFQTVVQSTGVDGFDEHEGLDLLLNNLESFDAIPQFRESGGAK